MIRPPLPAGVFALGALADSILAARARPGTPAVPDSP